MGVFSRLFRLCRADLHGVMDQLEDKELVLKQYLREMEESLKQKEAHLERIAQSCRQIQQDLAQRDQEVRQLDQDLDLAVRKDKDDIARMLIRKRRTLEGGSRQLRQRLESLGQDREEVNQTLTQQRLQYDQLRVKAADYCRRAEQRRYEDIPGSVDAAFAWQAPTEEEIELELLQRKETLRQGGAA